MHFAHDAAADAPRYFSFKDYLSETEAATFFELTHSEQVEKVTQYLNFLSQQPNSAQFTTSPKASISFAKLRDGCANDEFCNEQGTNNTPDEALLNQLLEGRTRSGFGAFGTEVGFLPQMNLSLAVAATVEMIGHTYIVEHNKSGVVKSSMLNSRSFFFYWCHAEKQKLIDIREKLAARQISLKVRQKHWQRITIVVDRVMCDDCIQFAECFARYEKVSICIQDPDVVRIFSPCSS
ncbi:uncharacterized protein CCR75_000643 [Bremia lactucae]|uniref:Single-strand DNA deaminase toxin A-like C-terminal domain-containing protein n=1 Tax=Bremia lactucae TaxID=4779 RepID=A0A976IAK3_BRELC|nr:hypothetical protein CCR75_000643 [Bremia lactucae]